MSYLEWHYSVVWPKTFILWRNLILFPFYYFSIPLHLRTLFAPWHRQWVKMRVGFHFDDFVSVVIFNTVARVLGVIIRAATIIYGLFFMLIMVFVAPLPALLWPLLIPFTLPFFQAEKEKKDATILLTRAKNNLHALPILLFNHPEGKFVSAHLEIEAEKLITEKTESSENLSFDSVKVSTRAQLFQLLAQTYKPFAELLAATNLKPEDVYQTALWYEKMQTETTPGLLLDLARIKNLPGIGHNWAFGYTVQLDKYARDLTNKTPTFPILVHRDEEINAMQRILIKTGSNNPLIIGEPGVARHLLAEILAFRITSGNTHKKLAHKRVLSLNMHALASAKSTLLEIKGLAEELLEEAQFAGNVILCIDEIDKYLSEGAGRVDLSDVIAKFAESEIGIIGITNPAAYHKYIESNSTLLHLFEKVEVAALDKEKTMDVLEMSISPVLERKYRLTITYPALKKVIENADRYITTDPFPSKANELLDEACIYATTVKNKKILIPSDVDECLSKKMQTTIGTLDKSEETKLINLENLLHERIINQEQAIKVIASSLRRSRLNVGNPNKPVGSFLFLGPTGVGKTETAKALASIYYGSEQKLSRFDMSQYQKEEGLERLIGSIKLASPGELTAKIADQPFSILLLDEFEKADSQIFNLFLTLLDEGYVTEASGKKILAKNNIIIATTNAGGEFIREQIQQGLQNIALQTALLEYVQREKIFSPELLNRFDAVVVFTPLTEGHLREVARLMLTDLNKRLEPKEISVAVTPELVRKLASIGFDPTFGARAMRRTIQEKIEDQVAQKLLAGEVKKGEEIQIQI